MEFFHLRSFFAKTNFLLLWFNSRCSRTSACWSKQDLGVYNLQRCRDGKGRDKAQTVWTQSTFQSSPSCPCSMNTSLLLQLAPHTATTHRGLNLPSPAQKLHFWQEIYFLQGQHQRWRSVFIRGSFHANEGTSSTLWCLRRRCKSRPIAQHVSECQTIPACLTTLP